jgi:hypothetical protein
VGWWRPHNGCMKIIGIIRPSTTTEIEAEAADYPAAKAALQQLVPEGYVLIATREG